MCLICIVVNIFDLNLIMTSVQELVVRKYFAVAVKFQEVFQSYYFTKQLCFYKIFNFMS